MSIRLLPVPPSETEKALEETEPELNMLVFMTKSFALKPDMVVGVVSRVH